MAARSGAQAVTRGERGGAVVADLGLSRVVPDQHLRAVERGQGRPAVAGSIRAEVAVLDQSAVTYARRRALEQAGEVAVQQALDDVTRDVCLAFG